MTIKSALDLIRFHESCRLVPYRDTREVLTCGFGCTGDDVIEGEPWTQDYADTRLASAFLLAQGQAVKDLGAEYWIALDFVRRAVLVDMSYELGGAGLAGFRNMLAAVRIADWHSAATNMTISRWQREVPNRAAMDEAMMLTGNWPQV